MRLFQRRYAYIASIALISGLSAPALAMDWTGFYVGVHGGSGWGTTQDVANPNAAAQDLSGFVGGVQAGYNHQVAGGLVVGVEVDASLANIGEEWFGYETNQYSTYYGSDAITSFGTIRGRLGFALDSFMPFVTGGLLWANTKHTLGCDGALVNYVTLGCGVASVGVGPGSPFESEASSMSLGWTVGMGAEFAVTETISLKAEYLYGDLGETSVTLADPFYPSAADRNFATTFSVARVGLNAKF